jgi:hypothetical protein
MLKEERMYVAVMIWCYGNDKSVTVMTEVKTTFFFSFAFYFYHITTVRKVNNLLKEIILVIFFFSVFFSHFIQQLLFLPYHIYFKSHQLHVPIIMRLLYIVES